MPTEGVYKYSPESFNRAQNKKTEFFPYEKYPKNEEKTSSTSQKSQKISQGVKREKLPEFLQEISTHHGDSNDWLSGGTVHSLFCLSSREIYSPIYQIIIGPDGLTLVFDEIQKQTDIEKFATNTGVPLTLRSPDAFQWDPNGYDRNKTGDWYEHPRRGASRKSEETGLDTSLCRILLNKKNFSSTTADPTAIRRIKEMLSKKCKLPYSFAAALAKRFPNL